MMAPMRISRRHLLTGSAATLFAAPLRAAQGQSPVQPRGIDATEFGVRANTDADQSQNLQGALERAANLNRPLWLAPGVYRAHDLELPAGCQLAGEPGATRILFSGGRSLLRAHSAPAVSLTGLRLDGDDLPLAPGGGLVTITAIKGLRIFNCAVTGANGNAFALTACDGEVTGSSITGAADNALFCLDSKLLIQANTIVKSGNGGIRVWRSAKRSDGSTVEGNTIDDTAARDGGDGQNGNAINVYRAADVTVRNNIIRRAAFSAIRGNAASHIRMIDNKCYALGEVAIYSEFDFEDATIDGNLVDIAAVGIAVTNMDQGGHGAVVRNNIIRNMINRRPQGGPDSYGVGIGVEADTVVSGNTIENAPVMGIEAGSGKYLRNVSVTGNNVRQTGIGIGVSVVEGAGMATIADNVIAGATRGAIVGMAWDKPASGDLSQGGAERYPNLRVSGNKVS
jgi:uncharacterized secreted repeat protein (TIGR03808 family)